MERFLQKLFTVQPVWVDCLRFIIVLKGKFVLIV